MVHQFSGVPLSALRLGEGFLPGTIFSITILWEIKPATTRSPDAVWGKQRINFDVQVLGGYA